VSVPSGRGEVLLEEARDLRRVGAEAADHAEVEEPPAGAANRAVHAERLRLRDGGRVTVAVPVGLGTQTPDRRRLVCAEVLAEEQAERLGPAVLPAEAIDDGLARGSRHRLSLSATSSCSVSASSAASIAAAVESTSHGLSSAPSLGLDRQ